MYASCARLEQSPVPKKGGIILRDYWQLFESKDGMFPVFEYIVASLDSAFTSKETNDPSAFVVFGVWKNPEDGQRRLMLIHGLEEVLKLFGRSAGHRSTTERDQQLDSAAIV